MAGKFKTAVIGLGNIAWKYSAKVAAKDNQALTHTQAYQNHPEVELIAGCSPQAEERDGFSKHFQLPSFATVQEMLRETSPDIISICSPSEFHYEYTLECLEAQIPMIWLEKPPATNPSLLKTLIDKQKNSISTVLVNYHRRYCSTYERLRNLYNNEELGLLKQVRLTYSKGLALNGSHMMDVLFYALNDNVDFSLETVVCEKDSDNPTFILKQDELVVTVSGIELPYHCLDIEMTFEKGRATVLHGGMSFRMERKVEHKFYSGF